MNKRISRSMIIGLLGVAFGVSVVFVNRPTEVSATTISASQLHVSSSVNSYIASHKLSPVGITKELHTFEIFSYSTPDKKPNGVVFHQTANPHTYSARNEADYEINGGHWQNAFVHTFIDANTILNIHDINKGCWGAGPYANHRFVQFELVTARNATEFAKSINNSAWYTAYLAHYFGWTLSLASAHAGVGTLWTHYDVSHYLGGTDHVDPISYLSSHGYNTTQFLDLAKAYYDGMFDKVLSSKNVSGVMQIDQSTRKDGVYTTGPYNTDFHTQTINTDAKKYDGDMVQLLKQETTQRSTYVQVKSSNGSVFWTDIHALKTPTPDPILSSTAENRDAVINQSKRKDGVYKDGPYRTTPTAYVANTDGIKYNDQVVHVLETDRTQWSTFSKVRLANGTTFWIDAHALVPVEYNKILSQKPVKYDAQVNQSLHKNGVIDGVYASGPFRTTADTYPINEDAKKYDMQVGHVDQEATTSRSTYAHITLASGTAFWIDVHGLSKMTYYPNLSHSNVNYDAQVDESSRPKGVIDGIYASGPYRSSFETYAINTDSKQYDQQAGHVDQEIRNANSTYAHITLSSGKAFWIDIHALKKVAYLPALSDKSVSYDAQVDESSRPKGVIDGIYTEGPYRSSLATSSINTDSKQYDKQYGHVDREIRNANSTYAHITLASGKAFWIDIHGLKTIKYDAALSSKNVDYDVQIDEAHRKNGIVDGVYTSGPYRTSLETSIINKDGKLYDQQLGHVDREETTSNSTYVHVTLQSGKSFWIDHNAVKKLTYYPITSDKAVSYDATVNEALHKNGVIDGIYQSGPYRTSLDTYTINTDSKKYDGMSGHVDREATNSNSTYAHLTLTNGTSFWIDIHGLQKK
ncbi:GW dipeptide domain-containing protein [Lacticaseibacillus porcinae]|uniref:GW dipeptide domain-containing protein n=1 Tax=Lacticaseibacillus porcinae TaxID=1123687 RepID=UPI000F76E4CB|nr:GW dipeptide domain-containing protein [Lacticaseibacillus porcinae]